MIMDKKGDDDLKIEDIHYELMQSFFVDFATNERIVAAENQFRTEDDKFDVRQLLNKYLA